MKHLYLIACVILLSKINISQCIVTRTIATENSTKPSEGVPSSTFSEEKVGENPSDDNFESEENSVYLEDVIYTLKNQGWSHEEVPCLNQTLRLLRGLKNFTLWSVWNWDSISSQPTGLLYGNRYQLGNFDECMNAPWTSTHQELSTQYCLAEILLERTDKEIRRPAKEVEPYQSALDYIQYRPKYMRALNKITWGGCVPAVCTSRSVERLMLVMLARSHLGTAGLLPRISVKEPCQSPNNTRPFDRLFYAFLAMSFLALGITLISTYWNVYKSDSDDKSLQKDIIKSFCLRDNARSLFNTQASGASVLYGIKFLTICFIVMDHQIGIFNSGPTSNGDKIDRDEFSTLGMFLLHTDLFVDSFFLLSGFLTAMGFKKIKIFPNILLMFFKRYVRLIVAFGVVIFFYVSIYPYLGSGPLWNRAISADTDICKKTWWISMLMMGNYVDTENICIIISWYIPCDFHFFVIASLVYWLYLKSPTAGKITAGMLTVASIVVPGIINYVNRMPAIQLFTYDFVKNPRASQQFQVEYIKSHTRFSSYIVGFFAGIIFATISTGSVKKISKKWSILGVMTSFVIMVSVMCAGASYLWRHYSPLEGAVFSALNRPLFACAMAALVLCCSWGSVPLVTSILSWSPFVPLSRLSYGIYLTHTIFITRNVYTTRNPQYLDYMTMFSSSLGVIVLSGIFSFIIWIFFEAPVNNVLTAILKPRLSTLHQNVKKPASVSTKDYFQDNRPNTNTHSLI